MHISLANSKRHYLFYFVATVVIYHPIKKKCLILKRSSHEIAHPKLWGPIGGKLEWDDLINHPVTRQNHNIPNWGHVIKKLLQRETMEEAGIKIKNFHYLEDLAYLRPDKVPVVCVKFAAQYSGGKIKLAPDFADFAWVDKKEVDNYQTIDGIAGEINKTIKIFSV